MKVLEFIGGPGLFLILAILVIVVVVYNKYKGRR
ncbi:hypothetical protein SAMN05421855_101911 [Ulvibacter litoralis]|uniref:Uncharacterized protein n=1 Tax=Ulvibacter litoralis TaxID=227084 RepID=A0A1G7DDI1_9FLAO|nr:hypothetical protein SAMN05421855_101911 [Ulvibacter litoralis]